MMTNAYQDHDVARQPRFPDQRDDGLDPGRPLTANEQQYGGTHYKCDGEEHWDRVWRLGLSYFQGQITKYVERYQKKNGIEDLKKARHFIDKLIELEQSKETK